MVLFIRNMHERAMLTLIEIQWGLMVFGMLFCEVRDLA